MLIGFLSFALCSIVIANFGGDPAHDRFEASITPAALAATIEPTATDELIIEVLPEPAAPPPALEPEPPAWQEIVSTVRPGDSLAAIFKRHNLSARDVHAVTTTNALGKRLRSIFPGHQLKLYVDEAGSLMELRYATGPLNSLVYTREGERFTGTHETEEPNRVLAYKHGEIDHSLFVASQRAGLTDAMTMRLAQIFQWDVDFVLDIRPGDEFYVLYEELYFNDEFVDYGEILAAEFINQGKRYQAMMYQAEDGTKDYFAPSGDSMRKAFLRAPVSFSRISSNFNLRRVHPLFKTVRPHRGIDYAAPKGTPILAAGDGRVTHASRTTANGNYVVIQHGEQFVTKYLHLSKFGRGIRKGAKVKQGQIIGEVGATGWATAPHLHYEFLVNGVHKNPRTVSLPDAEPISGEELARFHQQTQGHAALLDTYKNQVSVALAR